MAVPSRVLLLTRSGCHLCVDAEAVVRSACEDLGVAWRAVDIDSIGSLQARFTDHVPVTFVDRELLSYWFVDDDALRVALASRTPRDTPVDWVSSLADQP